MKRTLNQNKVFHALINKLGIDKATKKGLVMQYTGNRTNSSSGMDIIEMKALIIYLNALTPDNKMRKKIISIAYDLDWTTDDGKVDLNRINAFLKGSKSLFKKPLNSHTNYQLVKVVSQFEQILAKHLKAKF